jgi:hypothetical protein
LRKTFIIGVMLLLSAAWVQAQDAGKMNSKTSGPETIEGCLSMSAGQYNLIDDAETVHHLTGGAAKLKNYVGHQVEVTGKTGVRTIDTTLAGGASSAVTQWVFEVKSVKQTAETCK